jgi:hypothetical protein
MNACLPKGSGARFKAMMDECQFDASLDFVLRGCHTHKG